LEEDTQWASYSLSKLFFHTRSAFLESLKRAGASNLPEKKVWNILTFMQWLITLQIREKHFRKKESSKTKDITLVIFNQREN